MLSRRLIVCLDVAEGQVVKGVNFEALREMGDPTRMASRYETDGADEIVILNIAAASDGEDVLRQTVQSVAQELFIPLTVGGGIGSVETAGLMLRSGADKVSINSAAVDRPSLITEAAERFGSQCVVASIDARRRNDSWTVYKRGGTMSTSLDAVGWAVMCAELGAGEILLTSIDRDGTRSGYDIELTQAVAKAVGIPVIASGGGGSGENVVEVLSRGRADAALMAGALHDGSQTVSQIKSAMRDAGIAVRHAA